MGEVVAFPKTPLPDTSEMDDGLKVVYSLIRADNEDFLAVYRLLTPEAKDAMRRYITAIAYEEFNQRRSAKDANLRLNREEPLKD